MARHQVIIVGGGPVGVALAVDLGLRGIACALIETRTGLSNIPKGQNLTQRTLEHFQFWGLADELRAARLMPPGYPIGELTAYGSLTSGYWNASAGRELVRRYYSQANERLPQYRTEAVLRRKMATLPQVTPFFGWTAKRVTQDVGGVKVEIENAATGVRDTLESDYAVGCDGGHSLVRSEAGIERTDDDFDQLMVLTVFRSRELHERLKTFPERSTYRVMHPDMKGYWQFFGRVDVGESFFFHSPVPADSTRENFDFHALIQKAAGFEFACEFDHVGFWDLRVAVAKNYRVGRIFIAGDAAHSHPPYGGYGLNNGLEDVANLGWKLAGRLQGWGGDALLDSYSEERRPIFYETARDFIAARIEKDRQFLERYNPERDRTEFEQAWDKFKNDAWSRVHDYEPNYEGSPVVAGPPGGVSSAHGEHSFRALAGHHLTPQDLSSGKSVFDELEFGFALLAFGADERSVDTLADAARARGVPLKIILDRFADGREGYEAKLILVRPDQYVAWSGNTVPEDAQRLIDRCIGRG